MTIDRRTFVSGSTLVALAPALRLMPASLPTSETGLRGSALKIDGWSTPDEGRCAEEIWITVNRSWRAAWR